MTKQIRALIQTALVSIAFYGLPMAFAAAQAPANWTQVGMLRCKLDPSIGFIIFGHQSMECGFTQGGPFPPASL
jgi:Protein of unknown function (DUF992)